MARKHKDVAKDILLAVGLAGIISIAAATSPYLLLNIAKAIWRNRKELKRKYDQYKFTKALDRLRRSRMIILNEKQGVFTVELSEKGKRMVKEINLDDFKKKKGTPWDKTWRILIFDIPEKKKVAREAIREKLKEFNFYPLQKSVWVTPYPCELEIELLGELFDIAANINFIETQKIKNDLALKKYYNLL